MGAARAADDPAGNDDRGRPRDRRRRVMQQGRILLGGDLVPCVVRDLSRGGAKIQVGRAVALPERFALYIAGHDLRSVDVVLRWRRGDFAGVTFAEAAGEAAAQPTKL